MTAVTEFFAPFAHIPGRIEWCRIRSPTHGVFDTCIVLGESTAVPATVYVSSDAGKAFMAERYPECDAIRVPEDALRITERSGGHVVEGAIQADSGPIVSASMTFTAQPGIPREVPYGAPDRPVWGGRFSCQGVDLELDARVAGDIAWRAARDAPAETFDASHAIVTVGSMGTIAPLVAAQAD